MVDVFYRVREHEAKVGVVARHAFTVEPVDHLQEGVEGILEVRDGGEGAQVRGDVRVGDEELGEHQHWYVQCGDHE